MEQLKSCYKFSFQDVHIFNIFKKKKLFNLTKNQFKTSNLLHFNNGMLKIFFFL